MWRLLSSDLTGTLQSASHTGEVTDIAFGPRSDVVCTVSDTGEVFLLDLSDYMPITSATAKSPVRSAVFAGDGEILAAYDDGYIRAWSSEKGVSKQLWQMNCHRQGVTCVRASPHFVVTGGGDCAVRFWHRKSREMLSSFQNHRKPVADLVLDEDGRQHHKHLSAEGS